MVLRFAYALSILILFPVVVNAGEEEGVDCAKLEEKTGIYRSLEDLLKTEDGSDENLRGLRRELKKIGIPARVAEIAIADFGKSAIAFTEGSKFQTSRIAKFIKKNYNVHFVWIPGLDTPATIYGSRRSTHPFWNLRQFALAVSTRQLLRVLKSPLKIPGPIRHEIVHLANGRNLVEKIPGDFYGIIKNTKLVAYPVFDLDEIPAYVESMIAAMEEFEFFNIKAPEALENWTEQDYAIDLIHGFRHLTKGSSYLEKIYLELLKILREGGPNALSITKDEQGVWINQLKLADEESVSILLEFGADARSDREFIEETLTRHLSIYQRILGISKEVESAMARGLLNESIFKYGEIKASKSHVFDFFQDIKKHDIAKKMRAIVKPHFDRRMLRKP